MFLTVKTLTLRLGVPDSEGPYLFSLGVPDSEGPYLFSLGVPDSEGPLGVVGELSAALHRHQQATVLLLSLRGPVLITLPLRRQLQMSSIKYDGKENLIFVFILLV